MSFIKDFKEFAIKGNVVDLAVGIIIGTAFGKIVSSVVADIVMPPIGLLINGVNFSDLVITLKPAIDDKPAVVIAYGKFIQTILDFTIIALAIFSLVKVLNKLRPKEPHEAALTRQESLLTEIRDLLKANKDKDVNNNVN
ncbi:MAG: large-conductance mechanosensitive channel protein MscL [Chitinophagaceae bacterium]|nr:MAG: large-conductance mechanosensitive channel protein MscL [Chitinophagaceae bacterium]